MKNPYGWTGNILKVDLSKCTTSILQTGNYSSRFIGGLGIGEKIYWDESSPNLDAFHPDNLLIFMTGPLCGTLAPSAPRLSVCGKSPAIYPESFVNASIAGFFPVYVKKAGFDGIIIKGKAENPVYLVIHEGKAEIRDARHLWGLTNSKTCQHLFQDIGKSFRILSIGPGAEHKSRIGTMLIDLAGSASMGFGSVMGSKNLKAIAVGGSFTPRVADDEKIKAVRDKIRIMTGQGYYNLYGTPLPLPGTEVVKKIHCYSCPQGCWRTLQRHSSGAEGIRKCQTGTYYAKWDKRLHQTVTSASFYATDLANDYSLCVLELLFIMLWLERSIERGLLPDILNGLDLSKMGSVEFIDSLIRQISYREGFGSVLAEGAIRASNIMGKDAQSISTDFLNQSGRPMAYGPKTFIISGPVYATEPRSSITELHEICSPLTKWALWYKTKGQASYVSTDVLRSIAEKFWGGRQVVDFSTYDGKAQAAALIQNRQHAKECLILCDFAFPVLDDASTTDHVGDPTLESQLLTAVTGKQIDEHELNTIGERVFNLNRAILLREGRKAREDDRLPEFCFIERAEPPSDIFDMHNPERYLPGKREKLISHKSTAVDRDKFTAMMDEYYQLRGWDVETGLLKTETLARLDLSELIEPLASKGCLK